MDMFTVGDSHARLFRCPWAQAISRFFLCIEAALTPGSMAVGACSQHIGYDYYVSSIIIVDMVRGMTFYD